MKIKIAIFALAAAAVLGSGCNKTTVTATTPSLGGLGITEAPKFTRVGEEVALNVDMTDMYVSDNTDPGTLGIYWQVQGFPRDTTSLDAAKSNPVYSVKTVSAGTYTVTVNVFALNKKYYNATASTTFQAIVPETALTGVVGDTTPVEAGDVTYEMYAAPIGSHTWLCENVFTGNGGRAYQNCEVVSNLFGRFYTWEEAQSACPEGWRLPTAREFDDDLGKKAGEVMVKARFLGEEMWPYWPEVAITNNTLFNALPVGYMDLATNTEAYGYKEYACWWTSDTRVEDGEELGVFRYIYCEDPTIKEGKGSKESLALSVRCVKE